MSKREDTAVWDIVKNEIPSLSKQLNDKCA